VNLSEVIASYRLRIAKDRRVYGKACDRTVCRCGKTWETNTGIAHALCMWMYHQRGEILKAVFHSGEPLEGGDGLTSQGYLDAEMMGVNL